MLSRYGDSEEKMKMYITLMTAYGISAGIHYKFGGTVANTLQAHRVIQYFQENKGPETADRLINALYRMYFGELNSSTVAKPTYRNGMRDWLTTLEEEQHPSKPETLLAACKEAGIPEAEAKTVIDDEYEGLQETKMLIREQASNGYHDSGSEWGRRLWEGFEADC